MKLGKLKNKAFIAPAFIFAVVSTISNAQVTPVALSDQNSTAWVDVNSPMGMYQWTVDGLNHLHQQWFWFRAGAGPQSPINAISPAVWFQSAPNTLDTTYGNASYSVNINYTLVGNNVGSGHADILEGIKIHNSTASDLSFTFYQYSDFNLMNTPGGDQVSMDASMAYQWKGASQIAEGIIDPNADAFEANLTGGTTSTLYKLGNVNNLVLNDNPQAGPGDVTWAFQWDLTIPANSDGIITKDKLLNVYVIPEPSALAFVSLGFATLLLYRRTRAGVLPR